MSLNDRAAEAASAVRDGAWIDHPAVRDLLLGVLDDAAEGAAFQGGIREAAEAAAREALAPIQRLHSPHCGCSNDHVRMHIGPDCDPVCQDCGQLWPCDTAKLIYPSEELT